MSLDPQAAGAQPLTRRPQAAAQQVTARGQEGRARAAWSPRRQGSIPPYWRAAAAVWWPAALCRAAAAAAGPASVCRAAASIHWATAAAAAGPAAIWRAASAAGAAALRPAAAARAAALWRTALWRSSRRAAAVWWAAVCGAGPRQGPGALVVHAFLLLAVAGLFVAPLECLLPPCAPMLSLTLPVRHAIYKQARAWLSL